MNNLNEAEFFVYFLAIGLPALIFLVLLFLDIMGAKKSVVLYFESNKIARFISIGVKDGMTQIKKKRFFVDTSSPPVVMGGMLLRSFRPLYIFKHDRAVPMKVSKMGLESERSPENLKNLMENKTLDQLLTPKSSGGVQLLFLIMGIVIGGLLAYALIQSGVIPK